MVRGSDTESDEDGGGIIVTNDKEDEDEWSCRVVLLAALLKPRIVPGPPQSATDNTCGRATVTITYECIVH